MAKAKPEKAAADQRPLMSPGEFIGVAVKNRGMSIADFAKQSGIELTRAQLVLTGKEEPDTEFFEKSKRVFPKATATFLRYAELYHATPC
jgi:hypothetical protein